MGSAAGYDDIVVISAADDENNGQTLRIGVTLSAITLSPVRISNIRSLQKTPGKSALTPPCPSPETQVLTASLHHHLPLPRPSDSDSCPSDCGPRALLTMDQD